MNQREIALKTIRFEKPERIAFSFGTWDTNDFYDVNRKELNISEILSDNQRTDEWGAIWERSATVENMGIPKLHPLSDWSALTDYKMPDFSDLARYEHFPAETKLGREKGLCVRGGASGQLFERFWKLRGYENALTDFYLEPEKTHTLLDMITETILISVRTTHEMSNGLFQ